ncbi:MAG: hypothetical protein HW416_1191 [Chloroflexi bacterium]|nr:hypothetical protein [Chloroflexota bacterium]
MDGVRKGIVGLLVGVAGGAVAAMLLAPKRRQSAAVSESSKAASDVMLDLGERTIEGVQSLWRGITAAQSTAGLMPDERISLRIRSEMDRRGIWNPHLDVTTVDGTVYLRGRESDSARVDTIVSLVRQAPGVSEVVDEIRRE